MFAKRFILLLIIMFAVVFWVSGGDNLFKKPLDAQPVVKSLTTTDVTALQKFYRLVFFKTAVESKLNKKQWSPLNQIPLSLQQAVIAVEDNRFYKHSGFDINGILRAVLVNIQNGTVVEGGSTISQQLVKNLFLTQEQTWERKFEELFLAIALEHHYSKEEILEMYLNTIYFGSGAYGISEASQLYFRKVPQDLTLPEAAMLAGIPNAPSVYSPFANFKAAKDRQAVVLSAMVTQGMIGPNQAKLAKEAPIYLSDR